MLANVGGLHSAAACCSGWQDKGGSQLMLRGFCRRFPSRCKPLVQFSGNGLSQAICESPRSSIPLKAGRQYSDAPNTEKHASEIRFLAKSEALTKCLAEAAADLAKIGDVVCLYGPVGAGKSVFSRHFIRRVMGDDEMVVPSPTYVLQNIYEHNDRPVHHFDLYRLQKSANQDRLGMGDSFSSAISLIEWPERMSACLPSQRLELRFEPRNEIAAERHRTIQDAGVDGPSRACEEETRERGETVENARIQARSEGSLYEDTRFRIITATAFGPRWKRLVYDMMSALRASDARGDLVE